MTNKPMTDNSSLGRKDAFPLKLSDSQRVAMASACQRDDLLLRQPAKLLGGAAAAFAQALIRRGLVVRMPFVPQKPYWDCGRPADADPDLEHRFTLALTAAGLAAIGVSDPAVCASEADLSEAEIGPRPVRSVGATKRQQPKKGQNTLLLIELLSRPEGSTIADITTATGWLPHTSRAAISGLRHAGFNIARQKHDPAAASTYKIISTPAATEDRATIATTPPICSADLSTPRSGE